MIRSTRSNISVAQRKSKDTTSMVLDKRSSNENSKRMAEESPNNAPNKKRSALGDVTNAHESKNGKFPTNGKAVKAKADKSNLTRQNRRKSREISVAKRNSKNAVKSSTRTSVQQAKTDELTVEIPVLNTDILLSSNKQEEIAVVTESVEEICVEEKATDDKLIEPEFDDIDNDITDEFAVPEYACQIFKNMRKREELYTLAPYLSVHSKINANMRGILVDWLVEVQENFELYHETLYLSVKIVDHYLEKNVIEREQLQLLGATAVFLACKIEERHPPYLDDFLFICDDAYKKADLLKMEMKVAASLNYCLAIPIPYRFLRRFAKAAQCNIQTLTLARYILETSLLEYDYVTIRASKMAAACLRLAMLMKDQSEWSPTLIHYTEYTLDDLSELVAKLNSLISVQPKKSLRTVHSKYSHSVFFNVAKTPSLDVLAM